MKIDKAKWQSFWVGSGELDDKAYWTIEAIQSTDGGTWTILCSVSDQALPRKLNCRFAYSNSAEICDRQTGRGFPTVEARIVQDDTAKTLSVYSAGYPEIAGDMTGGQIDYLCKVLVIRGFELKGEGRSDDDLVRNYQQALQTPDLVLPANFLRKRPIGWRFARHDVTRWSQPSVASVEVSRLRWPQTDRFGGTFEAKRVWTGKVDPPRTWARSSDTDRGDRRTGRSGGLGEPQRADRADQFGPPEFRFEDVEVLGFRIELPRKRHLRDVDAQQTKHYQLISPLNFHRRARWRRGASDYARPDFHFRPASRVVNIELLRYDRMKARQPFGGMLPEDYQGQHELLVRTVVGRVDEDSAQAQRPTTFVPAIFVDNPWSKFLGRTFLGMDKRLAHFCVVDPDGKSLRLSPDGHRASPPSARLERRPDLVEIARVHLGDRLDEDAPEDKTLLFSVDCDPATISNWDSFLSVRAEDVLRDSPLAARRWRQEDFEDAEVRRDFARVASAEADGSFRAIQSVPIGEAKLLEAWKDEITWIAGRYEVVGKARLARPAGVVTVTLHWPRKAPLGWTRLCRLLDVPRYGSRDFSLPTGSWYRLRQDIDMVLENGLE